MMTDPISDLLTRIRNAMRADKSTVIMPGSRIKKSIAEILKAEGYLQAVATQKDGPKESLELTLKYKPQGGCVIRDLQRISSPGQRAYAGKEDVPKILDGLGICIVSTSKGLMTDRRCREEGIGGELLCKIW